MEGSVEGEVGDELVECCCVGCCALNVDALVLHVGLVHPPLRLHRCLNHVEDASDVGDVLN